MAHKKNSLVIEGDLARQWAQAQNAFLASEIATNHQVIPLKIAPDPVAWLQKFRDERHKDVGAFNSVCNKIGKHMGKIQSFMQMADFPVTVASAVVPAASPASLVVNGFTWLFDSFIKVSEDFDKIEVFFQVIASRFEDLSVIYHEANDSDILRKRTIELFMSCLDICNIANKEVKKRIQKWLRQFKGESALDDALQRFTRADDALRSCVHMNTYSATTKIQESLKQILVSKDQVERDEILEWLSSVNSAEMHQRIIDQVPQLKKGGRWLLTSKKFIDWKQGDIKNIWYTGNPGAGKSVLAHIIIKHLKSWVGRTAPAETTMVAYLYLSYSMETDVRALLGSVLRQCQAEMEPHPEISGKFQEYRKVGKFNKTVNPPSLDDIKWMLGQILSGKTIFIVVDALDEFDINSRQSLLKNLTAIGANSKLLVTSRVLNHLEYLQQKFVFQTDKIEAHDEDMDEYIESVIESSPNLSLFTDFHTKIKQEVKNKSERMFIIVRLHMGSLSDVRNIGKLKEALKKLPSDIKDAYQQTMERIGNQAEETKTRAESTLGWVAYSQRLLSISELQHALFIMECGDEKPLDYQQVDSDIIYDCCGLLVIDHDKTVRYVHRSAREFFDEVKTKIFENFDKKIVRACVRYLSFAAHDRLPQATLRSSNTKTEARTYPLERYAGECLHKHHRRILGVEKDIEVFNMVEELVDNDHTRRLYSNVLFKFRAYSFRSTFLNEPKEVLSINSSDLLPPLHIAVYLGNHKLVKKLLEDGADINGLDQWGQSPLSLALSNGLDTIAGVLLSSGAKIDLTTIKGHRILLHAMEKSYTTVVGQIIGSQSYNLSNEGLLKVISIVLLFMAAQLEVMVSYVLAYFLHKKEPTTNALPSPSPTKMTEKATEESFDTSFERYRLLLNFGYEGNHDSLESLLETPSAHPIDLSLVYPGAGYVFPNLRETVSDESVYDQEYRYISDTDNDSSLASTASSEGGEEDGSEEMDQSVQDEESQDCRSSIDLGSDEGFSLADPAKKRMEVEALSQENPDEIKAAFIRSACFLATENGKNEVVDIFLRYGVSPNLANFEGQSLLHRATHRNNCELVEILLKGKANIEQRDRNGRTALLANAHTDKDRRKVLELLLSHKATINATQREGCHELYEAAAFGATETVKFLLDQGIDPSITNNFGWTPLHGAAANGHLEIVKRLLHDGADPSPISDTYETPLDLVINGERHYDHILTGGRHYAAQVTQSKELSGEDKMRRQDDIRHLLLENGALTKSQLEMKLGRDEVFKIVRSHPRWQQNSWWDSKECPWKKPWYRYT